MVPELGVVPSFVALLLAATLTLLAVEPRDVVRLDTLVIEAPA